MDNTFLTETNNEEEDTIDLMEIFKQLKTHIRSIVLTTLLVALVAGVYQRSMNLLYVCI